MPARPKKYAEQPDHYWHKRLRSAAFKHDLTALIAREFRSLAHERIADVLDTRVVRSIIHEADINLINRDLVADLILHGNRRAGSRLRRQGKSILGRLDRQLASDVEALLEEDIELSAHAEAFIAELMQQEFISQLFMDIIFTAIVSFNQKVNPFFGALTMRTLEDQIKGFIRLFMPMLQKQATAFVVNRANQRIALDFARTLIRQVLNEPLHHYAAMVSAGQRKKAEALLRNAIGSAHLDRLIRDALLAAWEDVYETIRDKRVGELVRLEAHAAWLADRCAAVIVPALARPSVLQFVALEMARAARAPRP